MALVEAIPLTGRTHQIRIHLKESGSPILGDSLYGGKFHEAISRLQLHAYEISFFIQDKKGRLDFKVTAPVPWDFGIKGFKGLKAFGKK